MKRIAFALIAVLILIIIGIVLTKPPAVSKKEAVEGIAAVDQPGFKLAPEFLLKDVDGIERRLSDFRDKVLIIDFWATWCPPCRQEIPHFIDLYNKYKDEGLEVIGIALDLPGDKVVPAFVSKNNVNYTVLLGNQEVSDLYGGIGAIPTTFIVDKEGKIRKKYIGYNEKEVFERDIKELL